MHNVNCATQTHTKYLLRVIFEIKGVFPLPVMCSLSCLALRMYNELIFASYNAQPLTGSCKHTLSAHTHKSIYVDACSMCNCMGSTLTFLCSQFQNLVHWTEQTCIELKYFTLRDTKTYFLITSIFEIWSNIFVKANKHFLGVNSCLQWFSKLNFEFCLFQSDNSGLNSISYWA